jgi:transcriptional regulator GlxA family with amidase domain
MSAFEYLQKIRVDEACRLLTETTRKIVDVASEVGYSDYNFFNKTFKRIAGVTAHKYREMRRLINY